MPNFMRFVVIANLFWLLAACVGSGNACDQTRCYSDGRTIPPNELARIDKICLTEEAANAYARGTLAVASEEGALARKRSEIDLYLYRRCLSAHGVAIKSPPDLNAKAKQYLQEGFQPDPEFKKLL